MTGGTGSSSSSPTKPPRPSRLTVPAASSSSPSLRPLSRSPSRSPLRSPTSPRPTSPFQPPPLHLTIRFSTSIPDVQLDILTPTQTTVVALKHLIRGRLSETDPVSARGRLRFIHGGKILPDSAVLSNVLRPLPPPPFAQSAREAKEADPRGKGKGVEGRHGGIQRVYVNCSIGDALTEAEIAAEAKAAAQQPSAAPAPEDGLAMAGKQLGRASPALQVDTSAAAAEGLRARTPRGFDRLLSAGFTAAEVNQLRLQFRSIQSSRHTPDTMPSPDTLRNMEEMWMENNNSGAGLGGASGLGGAEDGAGGAEGEEFGINGILDVLVKGMFVGFMFPLGTIGWLIREENLWSRRWQVFATFGFVVSLTIGMIKALSGDK
ncbi:hypothetical protein GQ53DRAFT_755399 [Thozetella sp. PMI_491]|nr:hypothetical protein GQ53DRAFT_755399 [Thozetella sp. PMI_491]